MPSALNLRLTAEQGEWLAELAERDHGGNLSAAARQAIGDARLLEAARSDYRARDGGTEDELGGPAPWRVLLTFDAHEGDDDEDAEA